MKELFYLFILTFLLFTIGCTKDKDSNSNLLGTWIESELKTDTIKFDNQTDFLWLSRGKELSNGYCLPKIGSGPYIYEIKNDSIYLNSFFSSLAILRPYYFNTCEDKLTIGNFYDENLNKDLLIFIKLD